MALTTSLRLFVLQEASDRLPLDASQCPQWLRVVILIACYKMRSDVIASDESHVGGRHLPNLHNTNLCSTLGAFAVPVCVLIRCILSRPFDLYVGLLQVATELSRRPKSQSPATIPTDIVGRYASRSLFTQSQTLQAYEQRRVWLREQRHDNLNQASLTRRQWCTELVLGN